MTESLQTPDQIAGEAVRVKAVEVAPTQVPVRATLLKQVIDDFQNRVGNGNAGTLLASPCPSNAGSGTPESCP